MALIADETILEVKRALDIAEVISAYFPLKRAGSNLKAVCPFHDEKTPSFNVRPSTQTYHCFGCGKGGDLIGFVMDFEKVDYPEAIRILADRAGVAIRYKEGGAEDGPGRREVAQANEWAANVFRSTLKNAPEAQIARDFFQRRGVTEETAELFGLGHSLESWDHLLQRARTAGISAKTLHAAGLVVERTEGKQGHYDRFRGRAMFPIGDLWGKPIAFGARTLKDEHPKFINSPETKIFTKGRGFYGLHLAKEALEETKTVYIVEGYLDVVIPHQAGVKGLVATLGTALTRDHLKILRRYVEKVVLVFDADAAGQKASERGLDLLLSENVDIFVAELPSGMDPDDVVLKLGADKLRECLEKPREIFDFLMSSLSAKHGTSTPAAKARIVEEMMERVAQIPDAIKREILVQQVAQRFGLAEATLKDRLRREAPEAAAPVEVEAPAPLVAAARELIACVVADPVTAKAARANVPLDRYPSAPLRKIAEAAYALVDRLGEAPGRELTAALGDPALSTLAASILAGELDPAQAAARAEAARQTLETAAYRSESKDRQARLKEATGESQDALLREIMNARKRRPTDHGLLPGR
ncbi:MAG TPA: DNA primase [Planctomycetota bacterium]